MLKRIFALFLTLCLAVPLKVQGAEALYIDNEAELIALSERVAEGDGMAGVAVYLTADLALTKPFTPIGSADTPFKGSFCGDGHSISGLRIEREESYNGLFGCIVSGSVSSLRVENATVKGGDYSAVIVGRLFGYEGAASVKDCVATGAVEGKCYVGGVAGFVYSAAHGVYAESTVSGCSFDGTVKGDVYVGGIAGKAEAISSMSRAESRIENCDSKGTATAEGGYGSMAGGIGGALSAKSNGGSSIARIDGCLSFVKTTAENAAAGGISGVNGAEGYGATASVLDCVAFGLTRSAALTGGISGRCEQAEEGVTTVSGCVAGGTLWGTDLYPITKGDSAVGCYGATDENIVYPTGITPPVYIKGDANGDGVADNADAAMVLSHDAGKCVLGVAARNGADVNADGISDNLDATLILKYDAGIIEWL